MRYITDRLGYPIATVLKPAGLEKSKGVITAIYGKDPTDARWKDDAGMKECAAFMRQIHVAKPSSSTPTPLMVTARRRR